MAGKFSKSTINWVELQKRVPPEQRAKFLAFKGKSDSYLQRVQALPSQPPKMEWDLYQTLVPVEGLVAKMKSEYEALKIPYPKDTLTAEIDKQWASLKPEIEKYSAEMKGHIAKANKEIERINALPKFEDMTLEMYFQMFPEEAIHFVKKPSLWPHTPDEQMGYVDPTVKVETKKH